MSAADFDACLAVVLGYEGGFSDNPADAGAPTNLGVTLATLSDWLGHPATVDQVKALTPADVAPLYRSRYWLASGCDGLPSGVDLMVFDGAVNMGPGTSVRLLQAAVGAAVDGHAGPLTLALATSAGASAIQAIANLREARYRGLSNFNTFGAGWLRRLAGITAKAQELADA